MHAEGLPERIQRATGDERFARLDPNSPTDVDAACSALLTRLDETNDFELAGLIADLAGPPLAVAAEALARELGLGFSSDDLVVAVLGDMLAEMPLRPRRIDHFLAFANDRLREAATTAVDQLASGQALGADGRASKHAPDSPTQSLIAKVPEREKERVFQMCFHRLGTEDRRILRLVETERYTLAEAADILDVSEHEAAQAFDTARLHLLQSLEDADEDGRSP